MTARFQTGTRPPLGSFSAVSPRATPTDAVSRPLLRTASLAFLLILSGPAFAQALEVPESESFALDGPSGTYEITVTRPVGYDATSPERYPVLYYLDAWWLREMVTGVALVASLHRQTDVEPVVLVGIGFDGDLSAWSMQRYLDLTPGLYQSPFNGLDLPVGGVWLDSTNTGGADAFLRFLESDVLPRVEAGTHVDPERRGLLASLPRRAVRRLGAGAPPGPFRQLPDHLALDVVAEGGGPRPASPRPAGSTGARSSQLARRRGR